MISIRPIASMSQTAVVAGRSATRGGSPVSARMLRTPRAWAPSSSASRAIRFRSRVVRWTTHSRSRSCWIPKATAMAPIRTRPVAESLTFTTSTPASWSSRAASMVRSMRIERGGSISTEMTNVPSASLRARVVGGGAVALGARPRGGALRGGGRSPRSRGSASSGARGDCHSAAALGGHGVDRRPHRRRVLGRRAAAAADDRGAGGDHPRDHLAEVLGPGRIHELALDALGQAGVRLKRAGHDGAGRAGPHQRLETGLRTGAAVDPDGVHARLRERGRRCGRSGSVGQQQILAEGHLRDHGQVAGAPDLLDRGQQRLEVAEGLAHEHVDAAFEEPFDLLAERRPGEPGMRPILDSERRAERPDRAGDERLTSGDVAGFAGQLSAAPVHPPGQLLEAELGEAEAVRTESVRLDRIGPRLEVLAVDLEDDLGVGQHDLVEAGPLGDAAAVQQRAHRAVEEQRPAPQLHAEALAFGQGPGSAGRGPAGIVVRGRRGEQLERRRGARDGHGRSLAGPTAPGTVAARRRGVGLQAHDLARRRAAGRGPWPRC